MATILEPAATRAVAVRTNQSLRLVASASGLAWWVRTNGSAWQNFANPADNTVDYTTQFVSRRFTFDDVQLALTANSSTSPSSPNLLLNVCDGPPAGLFATDRVRNEALQGPLSTPNVESDDPPLGTPLVMPGANRDGFSTVLLERAYEAGGPANLVAAFRPGIFVDTAGYVGARTPIAKVSGLGPYPAAASYHHGSFYFNYDFGKGRTIGLTRVLFVDGAGNVAIVRGDGRRNTYRNNGSNVFTAAASLGNTLALAGGVYTETTPSGTQFLYDTTASNHLTKVVDRYGEAIYYNYDANSRLQLVQGFSGTAGLAPYLAYDAAGLLSALTLRDGASDRTTYFQYYADRNLMKITGPELCTTYFWYNLDYLAGVRDAENYSWSLAYDGGWGLQPWGTSPYGGSRRTAAVVDGLGQSAYFAYDASAPLTTWRDRTGRATYLQYNAFGSPVVVHNLGTPADYYRYDGDANLTSTQNRVGHNWYYQYDASGNRVSVTDPFLARSYLAYDSSVGLLKTYVDPLNRPVYLEHDASRNLTARRDPVGNTAYFAYQSNGLLWFKKDRRGNFTYFGFDPAANLVSVHDALGLSTYYGYNSAGDRVASVDALGNKTYFGYDKKRRQIYQKDAYSNFRYFAYDDRCNVLQTTDERGLPTYMAYDGNSNLYFRMDAVGSKTYFGYDAEDRPTTVKDARGNVTTTSYDVLGRRQKVTDPSGFSQYFGYDAAHEQDLALDGRSNATSFDYDAAGRLAHRTDANLNVTYTGYDASGAVRLNLDEIGAPTYFTYDGAGRRQSVMDSAQLYTYFAYDEEGNLVQTNVDQGVERATSYFSYDARNMRTHTTNAYGSVSYVGYDAVGNSVLQVNERGFGTYFFYDALNRRIQTKDGVHFAVSYMGYDQASNVVLRTDPQGKATYFTFDDLNRASFTLDPAGALAYTYYDAVSSVTERQVLLGAGGARQSSYFQYDARNLQVGSIAADTGYTYTEYDGARNRVRSVDPVGRPTYTTYDALNRVSTQANAFGDTSSTFYDERSKVTKQVDPEGRAAYFDYDYPGRVYCQRNALNERSYFLYDARGQRTTAVNPRGNTSYFRYDLLGRNTHQIDALGGVTYVGYDEVGNRTFSLAPPNASGIGSPTYVTFDGLNRTSQVKDGLMNVSYLGYDERSSVVKRVDADGRATYLEYDDAGRNTKQWFANPVEAADAPVYYVYDQVGNVTAVANPATSYPQEYDSLNRPTKKTNATGATYYAYDVSSRLVKETMPDATSGTYWDFDAAGRNFGVRTFEAGASERNGVTYFDRSGLATKVVAPSAVLVSYQQYDGAGRVAQKWDQSGIGTVVAYFAYTRNANGLPEKVVHEADGYSYFRYDELDRMTHEQRIASGGSPIYGFYYEWDAASNRTKKFDAVTSSLKTHYYTYDANNDLYTDQNS